MEGKNKGNITDRATLRNLFGKGRRPTQEHFEKLIDSTFNKAEDNLDINDANGLMIYPVNKGKLISFFNDIDDADAAWGLQHSKELNGLVLKEHTTSNTTDPNNKENVTLFLKEGGNIGVGTNDPICALDVNGLIASDGRVGNIVGTMPADGKWHNIDFGKENLGNIQAFEIVASAKGKPRKGQYCLMHAIALTTYGDSHPKISKTCAHYGKWWNKISIRWESREISTVNPEDEKWFHNLPLLRGIYKGRKNKDLSSLQMKTKSNYGNDRNISYRISKLWDESL